MKVADWVGRNLKAAGRRLKQSWDGFMPADGRRFWIPGSSINYLNRVGDGTGSSTVTAPLFWVARTFPEAPPALWKKLDGKKLEQVIDHPMLRVLEKPNKFYTGVMLWMATVLDYYVDGNAYWRILRNGAGIPQELWWLPHWTVTPRTLPGSSAFIDFYEYGTRTGTQRVHPDDIVHFRFGMDPDYPTMGRSPLKSVLREVFTDDEAAAFTASLLVNLGVPGLIISPEKGVKLGANDADSVKDYVEQHFTGDKRGEAMVMTGATQVEQFGFSPEQLLLKDIRRIPEERVTAVLGVPAIVAGLGAGLDRSTFTNFAEAREAAYQSGIIPVQRILAEDIRFQLLSQWEHDPHVWKFGFDLAEVSVLQEDLYRKAQRFDLMFRGSWVLRSEARRELGLEVDDERDNVFLVPMNAGITPADAPPALPVPPAALAAGSTNGHTPQELAAEVVRQMQATT